MQSNFPFEELTSPLWRSTENCKQMGSLQTPVIRELADDELRELFGWVDTIPLSRPKRNFTRDLSDGGTFLILTSHTSNAR